MMDLERALDELRDLPVPAGLSAVDGRILEAVAGHEFRRGHVSYRLRVALVGVALVGGVVAGAFPQGAAEARTDYAPLSSVDELAPSTLLTGR